MGVTLRQLEVFTAVARECHFGRAADALHVSQPVISQEIRRLEREIGADLFDRTTRSVALTAIGTALLEQAHEVQRASADFLARARRLSREQRCLLRVAVTPSVLDQLLPALLRRAETDVPDTLLEEVAVQTGEITAALVEAGCDLGLGRFVDPPTGYRTEVVRRERVLVALSDDHPAGASGSVDLGELGDLPLLVWPRTRNPAYHDHLMRVCRDRGLRPRVLRSPPLIVGGRSYLIADGRAFGLIPESTARRVTGGITVLPLSDPATVPLSVVWRDTDSRPAMRRLLTVVRAVGDELDHAKAPPGRDRDDAAAEVAVARRHGTAVP